MQVLFLSTWYPTAQKPHTGIFVYEHARAIAMSGAKVCVVVLDISGKGFYSRHISNYIDENGILTHIVSLNSSFHKKLYAVLPLLELIVMRYIRQNVLTNFTPDIIHSNVIYPSGIIGAELAHKLKIPHVITEHWSKIEKHMKGNVFARRSKNAYENAAAITCVSNYLKSTVSSFVNNPEKIKIVPNVVRTDFYQANPEPPTAEYVFTAVATWHPPKRPELFVQALNNLATTSKTPIRLHMFGDGSQIEFLKREKYHSSFEIIFHGFSTKDKIASQICSSTFFLHASDTETFSIVVAEALCCGTPVICSDRGALPELVSTECGVLCQNNAQDWESKIRQALNMKFDRKQIAYKYKSRFSSEVIGRQFSDIYTIALKP